MAMVWQILPKEYQGKLKHRDKYFPQDNKQFDIVISNPPYSVSAFKGTLKNVETEFDLYKEITDQSSQIECLFIERTKQLLKDGGVAGIILPSSILNNAGVYTKAREVILQYFDIIAIAELGSNTFMATGTNTVTLFLRRRKNDTPKKVRLLSDRFVTSFQDVNINGIEKPVSKYVAHVWDGISINDRRFKFEVQFCCLERTEWEINSQVFFEVVDLIDPESKIHLFFLRY